MRTRIIGDSRILEDYAQVLLAGFDGDGNVARRALLLVAVGNDVGGDLVNRQNQAIACCIVKARLPASLRDQLPDGR